MNKTLTLLLSLAIAGATNAQETNAEALQELQQRLNKQIQETSKQIDAYKLEFGESSIIELTEDGGVARLVGFTTSGRPIFYTTDNDDAAATLNTDQVYPGATPGYSLTGNGINIGEWDGGDVRDTHVELVNRVTNFDTGSFSGHATHVAGTMIATGLNSSAKGMAYQANISAYDFFGDDPEIAAYAQGANSILSNHSYGTITGWRFSSTANMYQFWGDTALSQTEDYLFGFYTSSTAVWDTIAYFSPHYLIVKSAGNDRNDTGPAPGDTHQVWDNVNGGWVLSTMVRAPDCPGGYDCISTNGNAKNILTVGAVSSINGGYTQPSDVVMSSFSGWGPTDDGRIKPDIVGVGVGVFSTGSNSNNAYYTSNGTSMSAPNVTGSLALVQQHHQNERGSFMLSSALKALVIHTANEAGSFPGPDYANGWGLMNTLAAVEHISDSSSSFLGSDTLLNGDSLEYTFYYNGIDPIKATICWTDPAGTPVAAALDPTASMLVNDLDLRAVNVQTGTQFTPWTLNPAQPSAAAAQGDNIRDNVEQVEMNTPSAGFYTFRIKHKGTLSSPQAVSIAISGFTNAPSNNAPVADFVANDTLVCIGDTVIFTDLSTNLPSGWSWIVTNGVATLNANTQNPAMVFSAPGSYSVSLVASNAFGTDSTIKVAYIVVDSIPNVSFNFLTDVCIDGGNSALNPYANPPGGVYTGTGVTGNQFDPQLAGLGSHVITYTYTSPGGCVSIVTDTTLVVQGVTTSHIAVPPTCLGSAPIPLVGGTPSGGVYTGSGVINNMFYPDSAGMGVHTVVYEYSNQFGCSDTSQIQIAVMSGTAASIGGFTNACLNNGTVALTGSTPSGGVYSGVGVDTAAGTFDPQLAGVGSHLITYTASNGVCISSDTASIFVLSSPAVTLNLGFGTVCTGANPISLSGGTPSGGSFSGNGVTGNAFNPNTSGAGNHAIIYTYTDSNGCVGSDTNIIQVTNSVVTTMRDSNGICSDKSPFILSLGNPLGGTYSGPGVSNGEFDPGQTGPGSFMVYYQYDTNGCTGLDSGLLTVVQAPVVNFLPLNNICISQDSLVLGASPQGGVYSGPGVSNGVFYPSIAGLGTHTINYTVTDTFGCNTTESQDISVVTGLASIQGIDSSYCVSDAPVFVIGSPSGGILSGPGISGVTFDPSIAGVGVHTIIYVTQGACADSAVYTVEVSQAPIANPIMGSSIANQSTVFTYMVQPVSGLSVQWSVTGGTLISTNNNIAEVQWGSGVTGSITATQSYSDGCADSSLLVVELWAVGVDAVTQNRISAYPNPTNDVLRILNSSERSEIIALQVISLSGSMVECPVTLNGNESTVNVEGLSPGMYWVEIELSTNERVLVDFVVN